jgi:hypothetical protein
MPKFNKHIIIVGSARSGTSWLTEIIATQFRYRLLFEPEHEFNTPEGHLICDKYFESALPDAATTYLSRVFKNKVDNDWIAQCSNRKFKMHLWPLIPKKFIIKFVRANLGAVAINKAFDIPVIHIIRNPYDVLHSQQRVKFPWLYKLDHFKSQKNLVKLLRDNYGFDLNEVKDYTSLELLSIRWCIENVVPLKMQQPKNKNYKVLKYEDLLNDIQLFLNLCSEFDIEPLKDIEKIYKRPSSKTHPKSVIKGGVVPKQKFSDEEYKAINAILNIFQADFYD